MPASSTRTYWQMDPGEDTSLVSQVLRERERVREREREREGGGFERRRTSAN